MCLLVTPVPGPVPVPVPTKTCVIALAQRTFTSPGPWPLSNGYATLHAVRVSITPRAPGAAQATQLTLTATHGPPLHQRARHPSKESSEGAPRGVARRKHGEIMGWDELPNEGVRGYAFGFRAFRAFATPQTFRDVTSFRAFALKRRRFRLLPTHGNYREVTAVSARTSESGDALQRQYFKAKNEKERGCRKTPC